MVVVGGKDAAGILKFIPRMLEAWPRRPRTQLQLVHGWQRAEHVAWRCAACFTFSHSDDAVLKRRNEPCAPLSGEFRECLRQVRTSRALSASTCDDGLLVFYARRGNHTTFVFRGLLEECRGPPKSGSRYTARKKLPNGLHPVDGKPFHDIEQFQAFQRHQKARTSSYRVRRPIGSPTSERRTFCP
eukprot:8600956-Pyramimonas_sp.AAC.1